MLGFKALEGDATALLDRNMQSVNTYLREYAPLNELIDAWVVFVVDDVKSSVLRWRLEAEQRMRSVRGTGLSDEQVIYSFLLRITPVRMTMKVADFIARFLPAYDAYTPLLYGSGPQRQSSAMVYKVIGLELSLLSSLNKNSGCSGLRPLPNNYGIFLMIMDSLFFD